MQNSFKAVITDSYFDSKLKCWLYEWISIQESVYNSNSATQANFVHDTTLKSKKGYPATLAICIEDMGKTNIDTENPSVETGKVVILFANNKHYYFSKGGGIDIGVLTPSYCYSEEYRKRYKWYVDSNNLLPIYLYLDVENSSNYFSDGRVKVLNLTTEILPIDTTDKTLRWVSTKPDVIQGIPNETGGCELTAKNVGSTYLVAFSTKYKKFSYVEVIVRTDSMDFSEPVKDTEGLNTFFEEFNKATQETLEETEIPLTKLSIVDTYAIKQKPFKIDMVVDTKIDYPNNKYYVYYREMHYSSNGILVYQSELKRRVSFLTTLHN